MSGSCKNEASNSPGVWNAGKYKCPGGVYEWNVNDAIRFRMTYTNWFPNQPDSNGKEQCIQMIINEGFQWNDIYCDTGNCVVCEYDL